MTKEQRIAPLAAAHEVLRVRYGAARVLFLAGSVLRGEATPASDLDIVVVYERLPHAYRESFTHAGWPVEAFVHDPETMAHSWESERQRGVPSLARMVLEGREVPEPCEFSQTLKRKALEFLDAGPLRWTEQDIRDWRYRLTDTIDDIRHPRSDAKLVACGAQLYEQVADFYLRSRALWSARRKAIPVRLREVDARFAARFCAAFERLFAAKRPDAVITLLEELLAPHGGWLFDGYRNDAPQPDRQEMHPT